MEAPCDVFFSYASDDRHIALDLERRLAQAGVTCFAAGEDVRSGEMWTPGVRDALVSSQRALVLVTARSACSPWIAAAVGAAWALQKAVVVARMVVSHEDLPDLMRRYQSLRVETDDERALLVSEVASSGRSSPVSDPSAEERPGYVLPGLGLLRQDAVGEPRAGAAAADHSRDALQATLDRLGIDARVGPATCGPRVTLYDVTPAPGVKAERIRRHSADIGMALRAESLRVVAPTPGRNSVGIEIATRRTCRVSVQSLMASSAWTTATARVPLLVGRDVSGEVVILDLAKAPHLLIAGATGSGRSACINLMMLSLLYRFPPDELRLILVDPKVMELQAYQALPHLVMPVIRKVEEVPPALRWVIREMESRYRRLAKVGARNLESFNSRPKPREVVLDDDGEPIPARLPYLVVVVGELADLMMTAKREVETALVRLAQLSRAVGIHTILATQRPSVNVITGIIKANYPTRIAFAVASQVDSRTILDGEGAETLLGQGDMLFLPPGAAGLQRIQGGMVEDDEIGRVVAHIAKQAVPAFGPRVRGGVDAEVCASEGGVGRDEADEGLVQQAREIILRDRRATTSYLQRTLRIGYHRAASLIGILEQQGLVGPQVGSAPREILADAPPGAPKADASR